MFKSSVAYLFCWLACFAALAGGSEYTYDTEGRTTFDSNKGLGFEYNHLDLVKRANEGLEAVNFIWDATGQKLAKIVGSTTTYYFNGIEYTNNDLSHVVTSEGIARSLDGGFNNGDWVYDYYLKDHLGNVRAIITEEGSEPVEEKVTVELEKRVHEDSNFNNVSATEKDKPYLYPYDPADPTSQKVSELNSLSGKVIGPAKVLAIEAGETIDLSAKYWYTEAPGDPLTSVAEILAGTLLNLGAASGGIIPSGPETGMALLNNVSGDQFGAFNTFINDAFDDVDFSKPQAYLVYMYFDKNMELDASGSGVIQVGDANALGQLSQQGITAKDDGFFYTYVTNRSAGKVNFDNMTIVHWAPVVRVVYDYYPYGLTWENPALPTDPEGVHDCAYQDKEFQFAEFTTGHGLALYDFHARMYDPCTARWLVPDPAAQFANPYLAMGNNPVVSIDPDGQFVHIIVGAVVGAVVGVAMAGIQGKLTGDNWWKYAAVGAAVGALTAATAGGTSSMVAGGSFGAGFIGSSSAAVASSSFGAGAIIGMNSGFVAGFGNTFGNSLIEGDNASTALEKGFQAGVIGGISGFFIGGLLGGIDAVKGDRNFWTGEIPKDGNQEKWGTMTIYSDVGNEKQGGYHSWLEIEDTAGNRTSYGTYGNRNTAGDAIQGSTGPGRKEFWTNYGPDSVTGRNPNTVYSKTVDITFAQKARLDNFIANPRNVNWSLGYNCSGFSRNAWHYTTGQNLASHPFLIFINTPMRLAHNFGY